jgi:hypothetical protein
VKKLVDDLRRQVKELHKDLFPVGSSDPKLRQEWDQARKAERTAAGFETWLEDRVTQVAVAWVLSTVFLRFCEDNDLIELPVIAGPGNRLDLARELQVEYFRKHPEKNDRDWICTGFDAMSVSPVARGLFESHNPMWSILPSQDAAKALLSFWRALGPDGSVVYSFKDWDTRFLGDLYQDLSEYAKKTYALLQTPVFVEDFILKYTLDPAIEEFGLTPKPPYGLRDDAPHVLRLIDPACGSGHFLLGAFDRLLDAWERQSPGIDRRELIAKALASIHGVDKNPFAVAISRFRLMLAAMQKGNIKRLNERVDFTLNIAVGDSLLHGKGAAANEQLQMAMDGGALHVHTYRTEDVDDYIASVSILESGTYHVVVGNPPYITVKDAKENKNYRGYESCSGKYALSVPFAERIFRLAVPGDQNRVGSGYTGQITSNSFMKREFGKKLIEEFFGRRAVDLTHVIDTSGAYIPGHGTPTVILFGRRRWPRLDGTIRAVLGVRGEPGVPDDPSHGLVWQAIVHQVDRPGTESEWVTADDLPRGYFTTYPWSLTGGGAPDLLKAINGSEARLGAVAKSFGFLAITGEDEVYVSELSTPASWVQDGVPVRPFVVGDRARDWITDPIRAAWPYAGHSVIMQLQSGASFWPYRTSLRAGLAFGETREQRGMAWHEYTMLSWPRVDAQFLIAFAEVATHNHFVLDRGGKVFKQTAPVIKLPEDAGEEQNLALLGVLNSSTVCFWMKQTCHDKGNRGEGGGITSAGWERFHQYNGTRLKELPLPADLPLTFGRELDRLAQELAQVEPGAVCGVDTPTRERLDGAQAEHGRLRGRMIALQEELDWDVYLRYGLLSDAEAAELVATPEDVPELKLGERAFEIVMARKIKHGELDTQWFTRHRSTPIIEIPEDWPPAYQDVVAKRIKVIEGRRDIGLIERPECKRRWQSEEWKIKERKALTNWLLDRCEERSLWYGPDGQPRPMTVNRLADQLRADADVVQVARLLAGADADLADVLKDITADQHVPYLASLRYKPEGAFKRALWKHTWDLQRDEDRTGKNLAIPVPPKYKSSDFIKPSYWRNRGKLDVPKERFISYPGASPESDDESLLLGWAGWDHREQALALITLIEDRSTTDGWGADRIRPLLAGLVEVMPWVRQWHDEVDKRYGVSPAETYDQYLASQRDRYGLSDEDLGV